MSTNIVKDIERLKEPAKTACKLFLETCKKEGLDIFITETLRTAERQKYLYQKGASKCDGVKNKSNHQGGMAWDIACRGKELYNHAMLDKAGAIAKRLGITWGGTWETFIDKPHFEVKANWKQPTPKYRVEKTKMSINGLVKEVDSVNVAGSNYIKLRDLQDHKINVAYRNKTIFVNEKEFKGEKIVISGNSYIKLRDLKEHEINVHFDNDKKMPFINA